MVGSNGSTIVIYLRIFILFSGTLGCGVARGLLGWGARNITFVDNAKVFFHPHLSHLFYRCTVQLSEELRVHFCS